MISKYSTMSPNSPNMIDLLQKNLKLDLSRRLLASLSAPSLRVTDSQSRHGTRTSIRATVLVLEPTQRPAAALSAST